MKWWPFPSKKDNIAQPSIKDREPDAQSGNINLRTTHEAFTLDETVSRCVNILVDNSAEVEFDVKKKLPFTPITTINANMLNVLLNMRPNPYMDISTFRRLIFTDFYLGGRAFIYWDGSSLYHIPESDMTVVASERLGYIQEFKYGSDVVFAPNEIIYIKDNATNSQGASQISGNARINSALDSINRKAKELAFKESYIDNGTILGMVLETDMVMNRAYKDRVVKEISIRYNRKTGQLSNAPIILDGGMKFKDVKSSDMEALRIREDVEGFNTDICTALGVPPILLNSGNNANIRPNLELLFYLTILPSLRKFESAFEFFFGYDLKLSTINVAALTPDLKAESDRIVSQVNNGIITGNEGRSALRLEPSKDSIMDTIRIPQNISGSNTGVSGQEGGKPTQNETPKT